VEDQPGQQLEQHLPLVGVHMYQRLPDAECRVPILICARIPRHTTLPIAKHQSCRSSSSLYPTTAMTSAVSMRVTVAVAEQLVATCIENRLVDALCFLNVLSDKCLHRTIVTRAHTPRQTVDAAAPPPHARPRENARRVYACQMWKSGLTSMKRW
jgi:hypothetical protein